MSSKTSSGLAFRVSITAGRGNIAVMTVAAGDGDGKGKGAGGGGSGEALVTG